MHGGYSYFLKKKKISGEFYCAPWAIRILYSGNTWRFLNFRSFSFLKEFFLQKAEGKAWWVVKNVDQEAESVVAGSLYWDFDFQDGGPCSWKWSKYLNWVICVKTQIEATEEELMGKRKFWAHRPQEGESLHL